MKLKAWMVVPAALVLSACDSGGGGGGGGGGAIPGVAEAENCTVTIPMTVTSELKPMYDWDVPDDEDGVFKLSVIKVENIDYIIENAASCASASGDGAPTIDERCLPAYSRASLSLENPTNPPNLVTPPVMHDAPSSSGFPPSVVAVQTEEFLENGVEYQVSVVRALSNNSAQACGCMRFTAGTADSSDTLCGS